jgi:hypothetical protein
LISFSKAKNFGLAEIHWKIVETPGVGAMNERNVRKWCQQDEYT